MRGSAAFLVVALAACGTRGAGSPPATQPPTAEGLRASAKATAEALLTGDFQKAYSATSAACQKQFGYADFAGKTALGLAFLETFLKVRAADLVVKSLDVTNLTSSQGEVKIHIATKGGLSLDSASSRPSRWIYEAGQWKTTDCFENSSSTSDTARPLELT